MHPRQAWLVGAWNLSKIGATVDYARDGRVYRQTEIGVKDVGTLTINADGQYARNVEVPAGVVRGGWRRATAEEMGYQGGDGLVLLQAKGGRDWIVVQDRETPLKEDWIMISKLGARQVREGGSRAAQGK